METNDQRYSLKRISITAFLLVSVLVLSLSMLVGYNLQLQKKMLEAFSVSYELRILLDRSSNQANLMFNSEKVNQLSDRILLNVRNDFVMTTVKITKNINRLRYLLLHENNNFGSLLRDFDLQKISSEMQDIDYEWGRFQARIDQLSSYDIAVLRAGNKHWHPTDALISYEGNLFEDISHLNHLVYEASLYQNKYLRVLYALIFSFVIIGMWLIWFFTLRPLAESLSLSYKEIMIKNENLNYQANHDSLTGLRNRAAFNSKVNAIDGTEYIDCCCLILIDLDQFKKINDLLGHDSGDCTLKKIAQDLQKQPIAGETAYRLGGDEFALFIDKQTDRETITHRLNQLLSEVRRPFKCNGCEIHCTCSIGVAFGRLQGARTVNTMFKAADAALYQVKRDGRNGFCFYNKSCSDFQTTLSI